MLTTVEENRSTYAKRCLSVQVSEEKVKEGGRRGEEETVGGGDNGLEER